MLPFPHAGVSVCFSLLIVLPVVSSAVFLLGGPLLFSRWIRFYLSNSSAVAFWLAMMVKKVAVGRGKRREKKKRESMHDGTGIHVLSIGPSDSRWLEGLAGLKLVSEENKVHFGTHRSRVSMHASHEGAHPSLTRRSPSLTLAHPAREVRVFPAGMVWVSGKVSSAGFTSLVLPIKNAFGTFGFMIEEGSRP